MDCSCGDCTWYGSVTDGFASSLVSVTSLPPVRSSPPFPRTSKTDLNLVSGGFLLTYHILQTFPGGPERYHVYANRVTTWLGLFTLLTNVMVTGLIAARLWCVDSP